MGFFHETTRKVIKLIGVYLVLFIFLLWYLEHYAIMKKPTREMISEYPGVTKRQNLTDLGKFYLLYCSINIANPTYVDWQMITNTFVDLLF